MGYVNYSSQTLRASAVTVGTDQQNAAVTLPESVTEFWVVIDKTAEFDADNVFTARIQAQVGAVWFDLAWDSMQLTGVVATAADTATTVVRTPNIVDAYTATATGTWLAHFKAGPSNVLRVISVQSGTSPVITYSATALYPLNHQ
jgi:hypothetical protein